MNGNFNPFQFVQNQCYANMLAYYNCPTQLQTLYQTYRLYNAQSLYDYMSGLNAIYNASYYNALAAMPPQPAPPRYTPPGPFERPARYDHERYELEHYGCVLFGSGPRFGW